MAAKERHYLSFLLRLWQVKQNGRDNWRASLEDSQTGEQRGFARLDLMVDFLMEQVEQSGGNDRNNRISSPTDESP
jgi:hypothetical protein